MFVSKTVVFVLDLSDVSLVGVPDVCVVTCSLARGHGGETCPAQQWRQY
jgi:hypothetical protein